MHSTVQTCHVSCTPKPKRLSLLSLISLARSRRELSGLSDAQLKDIGITPQDAHSEAHRPFWDVPSHWIK